MISGYFGPYGRHSSHPRLFRAVRNLQVPIHPDDRLVDVWVWDNPTNIRSHSEISEAFGIFEPIQKHGDKRMKELIADVSHWNDPVDYNALKQAGFVSVIAKSGQGLGDDDMIAKHAAGIKAAGLYLGLYYWVDPLLDELAQADHMIDQADRLQADYLAGDFEQWWASWAKWSRAVQRKIPWSDVPVIPSRQINKAFLGFMRRLKDNQPRPLLNYTSVGFINTYCREMLTWINDYADWLAQYPPTGPTNGGKGDLKRVRLSFDQLKASYYPKFEPYFPAQMKEVTVWQWTGDRFTFPGVPDALDISFWMSKKQTMAEWVAHAAPVPVALPWKQMHLKPGVIGLNVRLTPYYPSGKILRVLVPSDNILIVPDKLFNTSWVKLYGEPGYIHSGYIV